MSLLSFGIGLFCLIAPCMTCLPALTQDATPAALPSDPKALLELAAKTNGLAEPNLRPWHLVVTFSLVDPKGSVSDQGTFEEFWTGPRHYKAAFASGAFSQVEYGTEKGVFRSGSTAFPPEALMQMVYEFIHPIPLDVETIDNSIIDLEKRDQGSIKLLCLSDKGLMTSKRATRTTGPTYCLGTDSAAVRITMPNDETSQLVHNNVATFQGRFVPRELIEAHAGKLALRAHLETLESLKDLDERQFSASPDAVPGPPRALISRNAVEGLVIKKVPPIYSPIALAARASGIVHVQAVIGPSGTVEAARAIDGPEMLKQAAMDAVKQWVYKPYLIGGQPAEVSTDISVVFTLGGRLPGQ